MDDNSLLIMLTCVVVVTVTEYNDVLAKKAPKMTPVLAGFAMGIFLFGINIASPELSHALCLLILATSVLVGGAPIFKNLGSIGNG